MLRSIRYLPKDGKVTLAHCHCIILELDTCIRFWMSVSVCPCDEWWPLSNWLFLQIVYIYSLLANAFQIFTCTCDIHLKIEMPVRWWQIQQNTSLYHHQHHHHCVPYIYIAYTNLFQCLNLSILNNVARWLSSLPLLYTQPKHFHSISFTLLYMNVYLHIYALCVT